jgi:hypothetical protein
MKMKPFLIIIVLALSVRFGLSQTKPLVSSDTILPEKVVKTFQIKYPAKPDSQWVKEGDNFVITFTAKGKWYDVRINKEGKWIESVVLINYEDLPVSVRTVFEKSEFTNLEQLKIEQVENQKMPLSYKITLLSPKEDEIHVMYDPQGNIIRE